MSSQMCESPGAGDAARGAMGTACSGAAIETATLILRPTNGGYNHVVSVRRAPKGRLGRDWLVQYDFGREYSIRRRELRDPVGFVLTIIDCSNQDRLPELLDHRGEWTRILDAMMARIGGAP